MGRMEKNRKAWSIKATPYALSVSPWGVAEACKETSKRVQGMADLAKAHIMAECDIISFMENGLAPQKFLVSKLH